MPEAFELWERPAAAETFMIAGWRQWANGGSISSGLPLYLIQQTNARKIGQIPPTDYYLFQIPGTHDLLRPAVKFKEGLPETLQSPENEIYYTEIQGRGLALFLGDEPHLNMEHYAAAFLDVAQTLKVKRIIGLGGVYGELPYDKERTISSNYSLPSLRDEISALAVALSDYQGGASIGSYLCKRAGERQMEYVSLYGLVPTYDFSNVPEINNSILIENDFMAWLGIMRRVSYMLKIHIDLSDLETRSNRLVHLIAEKMDEFDKQAPQLDVRDYLNRLSEGYHEILFDPLDDIWEEEIRRLLDKFEDDD